MPSAAAAAPVRSSDAGPSASASPPPASARLEALEHRLLPRLLSGVEAQVRSAVDELASQMVGTVSAGGAASASSPSPSPPLGSFTARQLVESRLKVALGKLTTFPATDVAKAASKTIHDWCSLLTNHEKKQMREARKKKMRKKTKKPTNPCSLGRKRERSKSDTSEAQNASCPIPQKIARSSEIFTARESHVLTAVDAIASFSGIENILTKHSKNSILNCPLCWRSSKSFKGIQGLRLHLVESSSHRGLCKAEVQRAIKNALESSIEKASEANTGGGRAPTAAPHALLDPVLEAARKGNLEKVRRMVSENPGCVGVVDKHGSGIMSWAMGSANLKLVRYLVEDLGLDPLGSTGTAGAAATGSMASREIKSRLGRTPLHWAARHGCLDIVQYLVEDAKMNVDAETNDQSTPFHLACYAGELEVAEYLASKGANIKRVNSYGCGASHWVAMGGSVKVARWLSKQGIDFTTVQVDGHTALHKAALKRKVSMLEFLLTELGLSKNPAILYAADKSGVTAIEIARQLLLPTRETELKIDKEALCAESAISQELKALLYNGHRTLRECSSAP